MKSSIPNTGWLAVLGILAIAVILIACNGGPASTATSAPTPAPAGTGGTPTRFPTAIPHPVTPAYG